MRPAAGSPITGSMAIDWTLVLVPVAVLLGTLRLTSALRSWLGARDILDRPVERSSHRRPVPRGGGLAVIGVLLAGWLAIAIAHPAPTRTLVVIAAAAGLALISWRDDLQSLGPGIRLAAHVAAAAVGVAFLPAGTLVFQGWLPPLLDRAAAALLWIWFINLYNFMDGIDGITATETICLGLGVALVLRVSALTAGGAGALALAAAAAGLGFLRWNWHPAKIFLGDVGSVPLGYLLGWLLLGLSARGLWAPALILPLYYLADATLTLIWRLRRRQRIWEAHREHFYQRAIAPDGDHAAVVRLVAAGDVALLALAMIAVFHPLPALFLAVIATAVLLWVLDQRSRAAPLR